MGNLAGIKIDVVVMEENFFTPVTAIFFQDLTHYSTSQQVMQQKIIPIRIISLGQ